MNLGHRSTPPGHSDQTSCNPPVKRQPANDLTLKNRARNFCPPALSRSSYHLKENRPAFVESSGDGANTWYGRRGHRCIANLGVVQGRADGSRWRPLPFHANASDPHRIQPLGDIEASPRFRNGKNPFPTRSMRSCIDLPSKAGSADRRDTTLCA